MNGGNRKEEKPARRWMALLGLQGFHDHHTLHGSAIIPVPCYTAIGPQLHVLANVNYMS